MTRAKSKTRADRPAGEKKTEAIDSGSLGGDSTTPSAETAATPPVKEGSLDPAQAAAAAGNNPPAEDPKAKKVRVIVEKGRLGPLLLQKGDETEDPDYVALLKEKGQKSVVEVK